MCLLAVIATGCKTVRLTQPPRAVTEQLLLSTATDRAIADVNWTPLRGRKIYVEERFFKAYDQEYVLGTIRQRLAENGALMMQYASDADLIVEVRSGGLSADNQESLVGIPSLQVPVPFAGSISTPELALYKSERSDSIAKFALLAYERVSGQHVHSSELPRGKAHFYNYHVLGFITWTRTDLPEFSKKKK